jgi:hypothetical protein
MNPALRLIWQIFLLCNDLKEKLGYSHLAGISLRGRAMLRLKIHTPRSTTPRPFFSPRMTRPFVSRFEGFLSAQDSRSLWRKMDRKRFGLPANTRIASIC